MLIAIYILTFFLVLDCLFLGLLVLMQLPKKEAGLGGAAFGGGAVDALIGAGAGNVLTKATKYSAIVFFVLIVSLSLLHSNYSRRNVTAVSAAIAAQTPAANQATQPPAIALPDMKSSTNPATTNSQAVPATTTPATPASPQQP
jgi:preprotein translocase subunit SecG